MSESPGNHEVCSRAPGQAQTSLGPLDDLIADFEAEHGPIPDELVEEAMREWPDYEAG
jgi:hypothetical protein